MRWKRRNGGIKHVMVITESEGKVSGGGCQWRQEEGREDLRGEDDGQVGLKKEDEDMETKMISEDD